MKITNVRATPIRAVPRPATTAPYLGPVADVPRFKNNFDWEGKVSNIVVEIETDEGITGVGTARGYAGGAQFVIVHDFSKFLTGQDPFATEHLWDLMFRATVRFGRRGTVIEAISGVDLALWDIKGQATGQPVYKLLGGPTREAIECYANGAPETIDEYLAVGFKAYKVFMRWGPADGREGFQKNIDFVRQLREKVGWDSEIMIDAQMAWDVEYTIRLADKLGDLEVRWIEEPVLPDDYKGYAAIRKAVHPIQVAGGEHEFTKWGFNELIERGCVDILQPDMGRSGGITEINKIIALAQTAGLKVIPHGGGEATWHMILATPYATCPIAEGGTTSRFVRPSDRPGLSLGPVDREQMETNRWRGE